PVSVIRTRAALASPLPGQPGSFSLGGAGVLEEAFRKAGFVDVSSRLIEAPVRLSSAAECVRFEQESFGALHQMLASLDARAQAAAWEEIAAELAQFERAGRFEGPCQLVVAAGTRA
ncbi:MAG TPA: methyltransferase type 11, partial [Caldimonas sp.]|nr:methyltransferase type 11 [Caldimonas sp.]